MIPADPPSYVVDWPLLVVVVAMGAVLSSALGFAIGTLFEARHVMLFFSVVVLPITFFGAVFYPWPALEAVRWVQVVTLADPLTYLTEGLRACLTDQDHLLTPAILAGMATWTVVLLAIGRAGFHRRIGNP